MKWLSVIFVVRAWPSALRSLTPTDVPIVHGSPPSSALRLSLTDLPAMFTHVPDASAPTRLSALSDVPAIKSAAEFSAAFFICPQGGFKRYTFLQSVLMFFSWPARKEPKEAGTGEALRKGALPCVPHPPQRQSVFKNVPIFERLPGYNLQISSMQTPENRNIFGRRMEQRRGFPKGAHFRSAPLADFFGYFLVRRQESNITALSLFTKRHVFWNDWQHCLLMIVYKKFTGAFIMQYCPI